MNDQTIGTLLLALAGAGALWWHHHETTKAAAPKQPPTPSGPGLGSWQVDVPPMETRQINVGSRGNVFGLEGKAETGLTATGCILDDGTSPDGGWTEPEAPEYDPATGVLTLRALVESNGHEVGTRWTVHEAPSCPEVPASPETPELPAGSKVLVPIHATPLPSPPGPIGFK
jgi:hypothetical protein